MIKENNKKNNENLNILLSDNINNKKNNKNIWLLNAINTKYNSEKLNEIILSNNKIEDRIIDIKLEIDNIIKTSLNNSLNIQLKNINNILKMINEDIKKNNENINNLFSDFINIKNINNNISILNRNLLGNIKSIYFSRIIFCHLDEKIKLKLIKCNKN